MEKSFQFPVYEPPGAAPPNERRLYTCTRQHREMLGNVYRLDAKGDGW